MTPTDLSVTSTTVSQSSSQAPVVSGQSSSQDDGGQPWTPRQKTLLGLGIVCLVGLIVGLSVGLSKKKNSSSPPSKKKKTHSVNTTDYTQSMIEIDGIERVYFIPKNAPPPTEINKILLCFHGGGETPTQFLDFTQWSKYTTNVLIVACEGQTSGNSRSWQNAFPWMKQNVQNDVLFVDTVLQHLQDTGIIRQGPMSIFLTGKSDGAGFCFVYSCLSKYTQYIKAVGVCSAAMFGLDSVTNSGVLACPSTCVEKDGVMIPKLFSYIPDGISVFMIHGTGDQIMPYHGQQFKNMNALQKARVSSTVSLWPEIDPSLTNTYTADIPVFFQNMCRALGYTLHIESNTPTPIVQSQTSSPTTGGITSQCFTKGQNVIQLCTVPDMNHVWPGHQHSGAQWNSPAAQLIDATYLHALFFEMPVSASLITTPRQPYFLTYQRLIPP